MKQPKHLSVITELLASGMSYSDVARQLNLSRQRVHQIAVKNDLEKIWKEKEPCQYAAKKYAFTLGPDLYQECKLKFRRKLQNCRKNEKEFTLDFDDLDWPTHCPVLGIEIDYLGLDGGRQENSPSFDRTNSSIGYIPGNVQIISWRANRVKNDGTAEEHKKIADYIDKKTNKNI